MNAIEKFGCHSNDWEGAAASFVGCSSEHQVLLCQLELLAASEAPVLVEGETGTGKEIAARAIHYGGARSQGPFVPVNCGALPDGLIESELFGVERGAYTSAQSSRRGLVSEASGGTLFLDEVDSLSPKAQVSLLRFLQDQHFRPVGSTQVQSTDVRLIAATNQSLDSLVARKVFRVDLLYRLKILYVLIPPLRERTDDIELLSNHFIQNLVRQYGGTSRTIRPETLRRMRAYPWQGNVRELQNWVHRQFLMGKGPEIDSDDLADHSLTSSHVQTPVVCFQQAKAEAVEKFERGYLVRILGQTDGNVTQAAKLAGKERRAFGKLRKNYGIARTPLSLER